MIRRVRSITSRDIPELVDLCREHAEFERASWIEQERVDDLHALLLDRDDARCWVIDGEGELAGFATALLERSTWGAGHYLHLDCLYLRPIYRGAGLGARFMATAARAALELGAINLQWQTPAWNEEAIRFYERLGATPAEKIRFTLTPGECERLAFPSSPARPSDVNRRR